MIGSGWLAGFGLLVGWLGLLGSLSGWVAGSGLDAWLWSVGWVVGWLVGHWPMDQ